MTATSLEALPFVAETTLERGAFGYVGRDTVMAELWASLRLGPDRPFYADSTECSAAPLRDDAAIVDSFAEALLARGLYRVEAVVGVDKDDHLSIWVVLNEAGRSLRRRIHDIEYETMLKHRDADVRFELVRRHDQPLKALVTFPPQSITIDMRRFYAYYGSASTAG